MGLVVLGCRAGMPGRRAGQLGVPGPHEPVPFTIREYRPGQVMGIGDCTVSLHGLRHVVASCRICIHSGPAILAYTFRSALLGPGRLSGLIRGRLIAHALHKRGTSLRYFGGGRLYARSDYAYQADAVCGRWGWRWAVVLAGWAVGSR
jgi:hypothetical protein